MVFEIQSIQFCPVVNKPLTNQKSQKTHYTLVDKIKRTFRILLSKMPVFNVHFGQHFLRISVKLSNIPKPNDQSNLL